MQNQFSEAPGPGKFSRVTRFSRTFTTTQAARRAGISEALARQKIRTGEWPHVAGSQRPYLVPIKFIDRLVGPATEAEERGLEIVWDDRTQNGKEKNES